MTTTTSADLDLLRGRMTAAIGGRMAGHLKRLDWAPRSWPTCSAPGCGRSWPAPSTAHPSTRPGSPGSTPPGLTWLTWPSCPS